MILIIFYSFIFSSCAVLTTYQVNQLTDFPTKLKKPDYIHIVDSLNKQNLDIGYNVCFCDTFLKSKRKEFKRMPSLYFYYTLNSYYKPSDTDSIIYYLKKLSEFPKWSFGLIDINRKISGIGQMPWSGKQPYKIIMDSVNFSINRLNEKLKYNFTPYQYNTYLFTQRRMQLYQKRADDIENLKNLDEIPVIKRLRLNIDVLSIISTVRGTGLGVSVEPVYKWTNNSYFGLKASLLRFAKESDNYSYYSHDLYSFVFSYNFIPYYNSEDASGISNYFGIGAGVINSSITGVDDWIRFNGSSGSVTVEHKEYPLYRGSSPCLMFRDGIQSRFIRAGVEFYLMPNTTVNTKSGNSEIIFNSFFNLHLGITIGSKKWK